MKDGGFSRKMAAERRIGISRYVDPNALCPVCRAPVFFYQSSAGGRVFFDELGPPWPKHPCTDNGAEVRRLHMRAVEARRPTWICDGWVPLTEVSRGDKRGEWFELKGRQLGGGRWGGLCGPEFAEPPATAPIFALWPSAAVFGRIAWLGSDGKPRMSLLISSKLAFFPRQLLEAAEQGDEGATEEVAVVLYAQSRHLYDSDAGHWAEESDLETICEWLRRAAAMGSRLASRWLPEMEAKLSQAIEGRDRLPDVDAEEDGP